MSNAPLALWLDRDGALLRLRLARPKANVIDAAMIAALERALADHAGAASLKAVLLDHEGPHFSFGASVQEHMPDQMAGMLASLHGLLRRMLEYPVAILVAIRGQCLGGGLEVASAGSLLFAAPDAQLGQPEIRIGVFAPAASCILPERIGQARAEDLLLSGRSMSADEALAAGLIQNIAADPEQAALAWYDTHLAPKSAAVLRIAQIAARRRFASRVIERFAEVEALCCGDLLATHDAVEGLTAFLEKRTPAWRDR